MELLRDDGFMLKSHFKELARKGIVSVPADMKKDSTLEELMAAATMTSELTPFNIFARLGAGVETQPKNTNTGWLGTELENEKLGQYQKKFIVACNK